MNAGIRLRKTMSLRKIEDKSTRLLFIICLVVTRISIGKGQSLARHKLVTTNPVASDTGRRAVDGDYDRSSLSNCADTINKENPSITIDLGEPNMFNRIVVYGLDNHETYTPRNLLGMELHLDNDLTATVEGSGFLKFHHFSFNDKKSATYIKFVLPTTYRRLILCEVDVFYDSNISQGKVTSASSTFSNWASSNAVDGNTRRNDPDDCQCCAATDPQTDPWIQVDLGDTFLITIIKVYGRTDKQDDGQSYAGLEMTIDNALVETIQSDGSFIDYHEAFIKPAKIGREIRFTLKGQNKLLVICEVEIFGERVVSINKNAELSTTFGWDKQRGVDGNFATNPSQCQCCVATGYETNPWYRVDLGQTHKVNRVVVYGRSDGLSATQPHKGQSFSGLTVSLNSSVVKTSATTTEWIKYVAFQLNPIQYASSVTVTLPKQNNQDTQNPQLVVCELLVYGDCMDGYFGEDCGARCHCQGQHCPSISGVCPSGVCQLGYKLATCSDVCDGGQYGQNCAMTCGHCKNGDTCNPVTGHCNECADGYVYTDPFCKTPCPSRFYGANCSEACGNCRDAEICDFKSGYCTECADGFKNSERKCKTACDDDTYGRNCQETCGNCRNNEVCNKITGHCTECMDGYSHTDDPLCKTNCSGSTYGYNCGESCGACKDDQPCDIVSGVCTDCKDGYYVTQDKLCKHECGWGTYGYNCTGTCGNCRNNQTCGHDDGVCDSCADGYNSTDIFCKTICDSGFYGINCESSCGSCFRDEACHHINGSCAQCADGFSGALCAQPLFSDDKGDGEDSSSSGMIIGIVVSLVVVLVAIVALFVFMRKRRQPKAEGLKPRFEEAGALYANNEAYDTSVPIAKGSAVTNGKDPSVKNTKKSSKVLTVTSDNNEAQETYYNFTPSIRIHQLWDYIRTNKKGGFMAEFETLKDGLQYPVNDALANRAKNRYKEMYPYDHSRVHLAVEREGESEFINASHINGYDGKPKFIASQGPVEAMVVDFWRMVWQKEVTKIVMVTNLMEGGSHKCMEYWPIETNEVTFERITIKLIKDDNFSDYNIRTLQISQDDESPRNIYQYHYKAWPDKHVPDSTWSLVQFWREVFKDGGKNSVAPIVVHCSAGVGRTGTFIALDNLYHQAIETGSVQPFSVVEKLREQRVKMVQTRGQYAFLHEAVADALLFGTHYVWQSQFPDYYDFMIKKDKQIEKVRLKVQFEYMEKSLEGKPEVADGVEDSIYSNEVAVNGPDSSRNCGRLETTFLPCINGPDCFILTKIPDVESLNECWQLIDEYSVKTVIVIVGEKEQKKSIWSSMNKQKCLECNPELESDKSHNRVTERTFTYSRQTKTNSAGNATKAQMKQLEVPLSLSIDPEKQAQSVMTLLDRVNTMHPYISSKEPVIIQCGDGITVSSVLAVLLNEKLRMIKDGGQINILDSVMLIREKRKACVSSYSHFKFIHDLILHIVEKNQQAVYVQDPDMNDEDNIYQNT